MANEAIVLNKEGYNKKKAGAWCPDSTKFTTLLIDTPPAALDKLAAFWQSCLVYVFSFSYI